MYSDLLDRIEQYLEQREDVRDGSDRTPLPNEAMDLLMRLREARRETPRHSLPDEEDAARYRWFKECGREQRETILEYVGYEEHLLDHFIDKGRCGL